LTALPLCHAGRAILCGLQNLHQLHH
jgi:hypothetical protein